MSKIDLGLVKGVGVSSIEQTTTSTENGGTNVITCTLTDGTTSEFNVKNGSVTEVEIVDDLTSTDTDKALSANQGNALNTSITALQAYTLGNGTATIDNDTGVITATLSNFSGVTTFAEGTKFRIVFNSDAEYDGSYTMAVNGGTAYSVTVGNVAAGIGAFQSGKSYEFVYTGSNYDCLSSNIVRYKKDTNNNTLTEWATGKIEQVIVTKTNSSGVSKFTFLESFSDTNYNISCGFFNANSSSTQSDSTILRAKTVSSCSFSTDNDYIPNITSVIVSSNI